MPRLKVHIFTAILATALLALSSCTGKKKTGLPIPISRRELVAYVDEILPGLMAGKVPGVSIAIVNHETLGNAVIARQTLLKVVPIFVAVMVWLLRVLIIGLFSVAGEQYFGREQLHVEFASRARSAPVSSRKKGPGHRPAPKPARREPTYQPLSTQNSNQNQRQQLL